MDGTLSDTADGAGTPSQHRDTCAFARSAKLLGTWRGPDASECVLVRLIVRSSLLTTSSPALPANRRRRVVAALVLAILSGLALPGVVAAAHAPAAVPAAAATLEISAGLRGWHDPGDHVVVTAKVSADELFSGRLEVVAQSGATVAKNIQVAGGTTKSFLMVVPSGNDGSAIDVRLFRGNDLVAKKGVAMRIAEQVELVGVLPALVTRVGELPEQANLATEAGKIQLEELSLDQMSLGSAALDVYDTVVATTADIRSLQPPQLAALLGWLNRGGRLLLDDEGDLSALPAEWQPNEAGWAIAGRGEVRLVDGKASSGNWASIIEPSGMAMSEVNGFFGSNEQLGVVQQDLAARAGVKLPSMVPLLVPLLAYLALASVVAFFVLKALRRLTLAWVAIPLLAALTAGGVVWYGQQWRSAGKPAAAVFVDGYPGGGDAIASVLTFSRDGGTVRIGMPQGWQSDSEVAFFFSGSFDTAPTIEPGADSSRVQVRLEPGQVTTANVLGPTADIGLVAEAQVVDDQIVGTVTNNSPYAMQQVAIFGPGGAQALGTLEPGGEATFEIDADALPLGFSLADRVWDGTSDPRADDSEVAEFGIWTNASLSRVLYPTGMVRVAGWTTERSSGIETSDGLTTTTVVTSLAPIQPGNGALPSAAVRAQMVRTPFSQWGNGTADTIYRYVLPPDGQLGSRLVLRLPVGIPSIEIWNGSGWIEAKATKNIVTIPPGSIVRGVVMARIPNDGEFFPSDQAPELRGATSKDPA